MTTTLQVQSAYVVAAGDDITFNLSGAGLPYILGPGGATPSLTILGTVHVNFSSGLQGGSFVLDQLSPDPGAFIRIGAGGSLIIDATQTSTVTGFIGPGMSAATIAPFENDGLFSLAGGFSATGFSTWPGTSGNFVNKGTFNVSSSGSATGIYGFDMPSWSNSGTITVTGSGPGQLGIAYGLEIVHDNSAVAGSTITNSGTLSVSGGGFGATALLLMAQSPYQFTVVNSGTISVSPLSITMNTIVGPITMVNRAIDLSMAAGLELTNTGTITGEIYTSSALNSHGVLAVPTVHIHNSGAINGAIYLSGDGELYDGTGGTQTGGIHLGQGTATVVLGNDGETVYGYVGYPTPSPAVTITGGAGDDAFIAGNGDIRFDGGGGVNTLSYDQLGSYTLNGVTLSLVLQGTAQNTGGAGTATISNVRNLIGSANSDTLIGDAADNVIDGGLGGNDVLDGGGGNNTVSFASAGSGGTISLALQGVSQTYAGERQITINHFENVIGSAHDDTIMGDSGANVLNGGGGVNTVSYASAGSAVTVSLALQGQAQSTGGGGTDTLTNFQNLTGSAFSDHLTGDAHDNVIDGGTGGNDVLDGAGGVNTVSFASALSGVTVSLAVQGSAQNTVGAGSDTLTNFQNLTGSTHADHLTGDSGNNVIDGGGADNGVDVLDGGGGVNTVSFGSAGFDVTVSLALQGQTQDTLGAGRLFLTNFQNLTGGAGNDVLEGDAGNNVIDGGGGYNSVSYAHATSGVHVSLALQGQAQNTVGAGSDTLLNIEAVTGSNFADVLEGGGQDGRTMYGYPIISRLTGGLGADTFVYRAADGSVMVTDFSDAQGDRIDLSGVHTFYGITDVQTHATQSGSDLVITIGAGTLRLQGVSLGDLTASDFVFWTPPPPSVGPGIGGTPQLGSGSGGSTLTGGSGDDWLKGVGANNILHGGGGSDYLDGGPGLNTASYDGVYRQYTVGTNGATVAGGPEGGMDDLVNIQRLQFADGYLATSTTDTAGQVYRIYEATLGRAPDAVGLANWVHALNNGATLQSVVNGFVGSNEFQALYGNLDNTGFVTLLYQNVLHRAPDAAGLTSWLNFLAAGHSRAEVVTGFSESPEDIGALAAPVQAGLWIEDAAAAQAARLYDAVLGRLPDAAGLASWTHNLAGGMTLQQAANGFTGSAEFQANYGSLSDSAFVNLLYQNVLHRPADQAGLSNWLSYLASGHTRADVVLGFSESNEHIANLAPHIDNGVWIAG
jgi:hypothetical protein